MRWEDALPPLGHPSRVPHSVMLSLCSCGISDAVLLARFTQFVLDGNFFTFERLANMPVTELVEILKPFSRWEQNCVRIKLFAEFVLQHGFPMTIDELCDRHGVRNKVGCLILWGAFGISAGIPVDRHVHRFAVNSDWTNATDDDEIAQQLCSWIPQSQWLSVNDNIAGLSQMLTSHPNEVLAAATELGPAFISIIDSINTKEPPASK